MFYILYLLHYFWDIAVAHELIAIFCIQGVPMILQSHNGWEFIACIIVVIIVHGWAMHPKSHGSIEHANKDMEEMWSN